jgi:hypothetical protein
VALDLQLPEHRQAEPEVGAVELHAVAGDHARPLERAQPAQAAFSGLYVAVPAAVALIVVGPAAVTRRGRLAPPNSGR